MAQAITSKVTDNITNACISTVSNLIKVGSSHHGDVSSLTSKILRSLKKSDFADRESHDTDRRSHSPRGHGKSLLDMILKSVKTKKNRYRVPVPAGADPSHALGPAGAALARHLDQGLKVRGGSIRGGANLSSNLASGTLHLARSRAVVVVVIARLVENHLSLFVLHRQWRSLRLKVQTGRTR